MWLETGRQEGGPVALLEHPWRDSQRVQPLRKIKCTAILFIFLLGVHDVHPSNFHQDLLCFSGSILRWRIAYLVAGWSTPETTRPWDKAGEASKDVN